METEEQKLLNAPAEHNPAAELKTTADFVDEVSSAAHVAPVAKIKDGFDPAIHKADENGVPILGSKKQFLLKKEAKKTAREKIREGISNILGKKEITEKSDISEGIPLSDHELHEKEKEEEQRQSEIPRTDKELEKSARRSANGILLGGCALLGKELYRQRSSRDFDDLVGHCYDWEKETGHKVELHPNLAFPLAVIGSIYAMAQSEAPCKERLDNGIDVARENIMGVFGEKIPFLQIFNKKQEITEKEADND